MRILFVIESLGFGGAERALVNLIPALLKRGVKCEVVALWAPYTLGKELEAIGVTVHRLELLHRWNIPEAIYKLASVHRRGFDVIDAHLFFAGIYTALSALAGDRTLRVVTFHALSYDTNVWGDSPWKRMRRVLDSTLAQHYIDGHIAISHAVASHMKEHLRLASVEMIHNAYQLDRLKSETALDRFAVLDRIQPGLGREFVVATPARLSHEKGHLYLFEALEQLQHDGLNPRALLLGAGPMEATLRSEVVRRGLKNQVSFLGTVPHSDLLQIVQCVDAVVMPSTHEGLPLAAVEAMALGRPVLATTVGGVPELIVDNVSGILVAPTDVTALTTKLKELMTNAALRKRLGCTARERIQAEFSADLVVEKRLQYYATLRKRRDRAG